MKTITKENQGEYKVECAISIIGHEKKCYPFVGTKKECWEYIYLIGVELLTTNRRQRNLQHFCSMHRFDNSESIFVALERDKNYMLRLKLFYKIVINN